jgi:hypothetical protein
VEICGVGVRHLLQRGVMGVLTGLTRTLSRCNCDPKCQHLLHALAPGSTGLPRHKSCCPARSILSRSLLLSLLSHTLRAHRKSWIRGSQHNGQAWARPGAVRQVEQLPYFTEGTWLRTVYRQVGSGRLATRGWFGDLGLENTVVAVSIGLQVELE